MAAAVILLALASAGCGLPPERLGSVTGRVTFEGVPVRKGLIVFSNAKKGVHVVAELDSDGEYEVQMAKGYGLPIGVYQVSVSPPLPNLPSVGPIPPNAEIMECPNIPARYRQPSSSGLTVTVPEDGVVYNVNMEP